MDFIEDERRRKNVRASPSLVGVKAQEIRGVIIQHSEREVWAHD